MSDVPGIDSAIEYAAREMHLQLHGAGLYDQLGGLEQGRWRRMAKAVNDAFHEHNRRVAEEMISEKDREWLGKVRTLRTERDMYRQSVSDAAVELGVAIQERRQMQEALFAAWAERDALRAEVATLQRSASACSCRPVPASRTHGGGLDVDPECPSHGSGKGKSPSSDEPLEFGPHVDFAEIIRRLLKRGDPSAQVDMPAIGFSDPDNWFRFGLMKDTDWIGGAHEMAGRAGVRIVKGDDGVYRLEPLPQADPVLAALRRLVELRHSSCGTDEEWLKDWVAAWVEARGVVGETEGSEENE